MSKEFFEQPASTVEQEKFDAAIQSINKNLLTVVHAALDFDWHDMEQSEVCFTRLAELDECGLSFHRNLSDNTQRLFGFKFLTAVARDSTESVIISISKSAEIGARIACQLLFKHHARCTFRMPTIYFESVGDTACEDIFDRLEKVELVLFDETLEQLKALEAVAENVADEVLQLSTMCTLTNDYTPFYDYLKNWETAQTTE